MTAAVTAPAEAPVAAGGGRRRLKHAEHPDRPGEALCGATGESDRCVVCHDLTRRSWLAR